MDINSREFLTGCALIAIMIDKNMERSSGDLHVLTSAINRLAPNQSRLAHAGVGIERLSHQGLAQAAVALADACIAELDIDPE